MPTRRNSRLAYPRKSRSALQIAASDGLFADESSIIIPLVISSPRRNMFPPALHAIYKWTAIVSPFSRQGISIILRITYKICRDARSWFRVVAMSFVVLFSTFHEHFSLLLQRERHYMKLSHLPWQEFSLCIEKKVQIWTVGTKYFMYGALLKGIWVIFLKI